ncbi:hypothetical protein CEE45_05770 [Candidatus Heimdallarchaeota archaeon B3_Heim]|nr:MAG: hypothetical protein CEE45_05770 [Candidatus Heimdallarchaeota archaeon B3_Heim]
MKQSLSVITLSIVIWLFLVFGSPISGVVHQDIPIGEEYASGTITQPGFDFSYAWVNTSNTSFLSITIFNEEDGEAPFYPFFGQYFNNGNDSFYIGTTIIGFELYQDINDNDILDLKEELKYYILINCSQDYILPQIERSITATSILYTWKVGYMETDGHLFPSTPPYGKKAIIENLNLTYAFEVSSNYSELKLSIEMGTWDVFEYGFEGDQEVRIQDVNLDNYSLSILFGNIVSCETAFELILVNGTNGMSDAIIKVNDEPIFQSLFHDTYDLGLNDSAYSAIASPVTLETLFSDQISEWNAPQNLYNWWGSFFPSMSDLPTIPPLGIEEATFPYRICYPTWGGEPFNHDPRYRALFEGSSIIFPTDIPSSFPTTTEHKTTAQPTSSYLFPDVLILIIIMPFLKKKKKL